jgi:hypothetical protein
MYVVLIASGGNQRYIFSSNKRKEIVGASDLIARLDTTWGMEVLGREFPGFTADWRVRTHDAELLVAGAGRITALVRDPDAGRRLVTEVTMRALREAPGMDVCGVVVEHVADAQQDLAATIRRAEAELAAVRETRPGPQSRYLRLPLVEDCDSSGAPAAGVRAEGRDEPSRPRSAASLAKLNAFGPALVRLAGDAGVGRDGAGAKKMRRIVDRLGLEAEWVGVVHADGNGLGAIFRGLGELAREEGDERYADLLRRVSRGVDRCARQAFRTALRRTIEEYDVTSYGGIPAVLPLVLGGDDLTVVCEGEVALPFTRHYLEAFEETTRAHDDLQEMLRRVGRAQLSAGAGVAIVKRNYPFRFAYGLAEDLAGEAKRVKAVGSALSFAVLVESAPPELARIRRSATLLGGAGGSAGPYFVGTAADAQARGRTWEDLAGRVAALTRTVEDTGEPLIPRGAVHELREGLCLGADIARSRFAQLKRRYAGDGERTRALNELAGDQGELLWREHDQKEVSGLPDALAALPFVPPARRTSGDEALRNRQVAEPKR